MNRYALSFTIKPGSEPAVAEILRSYRRPTTGATGGPPLLRRTSVFMAGLQVVRVIDVDGDISEVMRHLAGQPQIRAVEDALDPHLATPRDLGSPDGVQAFLHQALLPAARHQVAPPAQLSDVEVGQQGERCGLLYPVRAGQGENAARLLADGGPPAIVSSTTFRRGDLLVRMIEVDGDVSDALDQLARDASHAPTTPALRELVETPADLRTESGFRSFLEDCRMELLTDRRVGVPA